MITVSDFYKKIFGTKVYKISLDLGCTCPTRDGTKGIGGCIFCSQSGSGDFVSDRKLSILEQVEQAKELVNRKFSRAAKRGEEVQKKYIAYFQNYTNTYGNTETLVAKYKEALSAPDVVGLALGTRPDCLKEDMLLELGELSKNHFIQIELGLQTINEKTAEYCRRGFENQVYVDAVRRLNEISENRIHIVTHLIFGLPGDTEEDMLNAVDFVCNTNENSAVTSFDSSFGIKITSLYVLKGTDLANDYFLGRFNTLQEDEYLALVEKAIKHLTKKVVVHRLTGDPPKALLIAPEWTTNKRKMMNKISALCSQ